MKVVIDRRKNPKGKSLVNRQRFLERVRDSFKESQDDLKKNINSNGDVNISVSKKQIKEPQFHYDRSTGVWDSILPGNKEYVPGDTIDKPPGGGGQGGGSEASDTGGGEDDFRFSVTREEYFNIIFEDLDLPDMVKKSQKKSKVTSRVRAGYTTVGQESNLNVIKTVITSLGRRISLKEPIREELELLERDKIGKTEEEIQEIDLRIEQLLKSKGIGFLENVDLRYNNFTTIQRPSTHAVVFCVMDVSGSMDEKKKTIAKKFFLLLYTFLKKKYKDIDVVFISHTEVAEEVDEEKFFYDPKSGGTIISSAFEVVDKIIKERYNIDETNIYIAQATDGDNFGSDNEKLAGLLAKLVPLTQMMTYIEMNDSYGNTAVWNTILTLSHRDTMKNLEMRKIRNEADIIPAFRDIFRKR